MPSPIQSSSFVQFSANRTLEEAETIYRQRIEDALDIYEKHYRTFALRPCFCCGESDTTPLEPFHGTYGVHRCNRCGSQFVSPVPTTEALSDYYNHGTCNILLNELLKKRYRQQRNFILDDRIAFLLNYVRQLPTETVRVLEVGCNSGSLLAKLKHFIATEVPNKNAELFGIDIDRSAVERPVDSDLKLTCADAQTFASSTDTKFDLILHFELIEHLHDPFTFVQQLHQLLKPGGYMVFTTPNVLGLEMIASSYNAYRLLAHGIFPPMHLNAFSTQNMLHFALRSGFKLLHIDTPGKLDVDMVSLCVRDVTDETLRKLAALDDGTKGLIQHVVALLNGSSHMRCVFGK